MIEVKISRIGSVTVEVTMDEGATVSDALSAANIAVGESEKVYLNGNQVPLNFVLTTDCRIHLAKDAKSG